MQIPDDLKPVRSHQGLLLESYSLDAVCMEHLCVLPLYAVNSHLNAGTTVPDMSWCSRA